MTKYIYIISAAIAILCLSSCQHDEEMPAVTKEGFRIKAYVSDPVLSRATAREDDGFSVAGFNSDDHVGFFSEGGDRNNSNGKFENCEMYYSGGYFINDKMSVDVNRLGKTLLYYPYSEQTNGRQVIRNSETNEVNDVLFSVSVGNPDNQDKNALSARFGHLFAMLVIDGGYGFENFHEREVSVTMPEPVETVEFRRNDSELGYYVCLNGGYTEGTKPNESFATVVGHYNKEKGKYYVIVPTNGDGMVVKSINAYDNSGRLHKIKCNMWVGVGNRYFLTLELNELVPTIYQHGITPWDNGIDLDANAAKGIGSETDMKNWIEEYNKETPNEDILLNYGDKVLVTNAQGGTLDTYWRFYLTANIDLSKIDAGTGHLVHTLKDEFDGCGYTITGFSLKGDNPALFNVIEGDHACVKNLAVDNLVINATATNVAVGALVTEFKSGSIENCSFTNLSLHAIHSAAGALAGTITGGDKAKVENCKFSGAIFGTSTVNKIAGTGTVSADVRKGCDVSNVMFGQTAN